MLESGGISKLRRQKEKSPGRHEHNGGIYPHSHCSLSPSTGYGVGLLWGGCKSATGGVRSFRGGEIRSAEDARSACSWAEGGKTAARANMAGWRIAVTSDWRDSSMVGRRLAGRQDTELRWCVAAGSVPAQSVHAQAKERCGWGSDGRRGAEGCASLGTERRAWRGTNQGRRHSRTDRDLAAGGASHSMSQAHRLSRHCLLPATMWRSITAQRQQSSATAAL